MLTPKSGPRKALTAQSLVGFDPFSPIQGDTAPASAYSSMESHGENTSMINFLPHTPMRGDHHRDHREGNDNQNNQNQNIDQLRNELMAIASHIEKESPRCSSSTTPLTSPTPTRRASLAPLLRGKKPSSSTNNTPTGNRNPFASFTKKRTGGGGQHRKTQSLAANTRLWKEVQGGLSPPTPVQTRSASIASTNAPPSSANNHPLTTIPQGVDVSFLQDLWMSMSKEDEEKNRTSEGPESLYIPNLAKPRPTSLLTSNDAVSSWEHDPASWQYEIPEKSEFLLAARLSLFLDTYRKQECLLDLASLQGHSRMQLSQFAAGGPGPTQIADCHRPVVESLLDCGSDLVEVRGYFHSDAQDLDQRREVLVVECQRQFVVVFRGTTAEQQQGSKSSGKQQPIVALKDVALKDVRKATVLSSGFHALMELEEKTFSLVDQLTDDSPFCDIVFAGHSFGASMATLAAYLYSHTRVDQRVAALVTASPKVGLNDFRSAVHAQPNLKVMRVEYGSCSAARTPQAHHVGHTLRISPSPQLHIKAYKFHDEDESSFGSLLFKRERNDVRDYVQALEELPSWVKDYHNQDGSGVRGKDNEKREVV
jgi:hypothetical protein